MSTSRRRASPQAVATLRAVDRLAGTYGGDSGPRKLALLQRLERISLPTVRDVRTLHERLCFLAAYPDDAALFGQVWRMLQAFASRPDLRRHRQALADTGIAGTNIYYRFAAPTARWLARRWGRFLALDWEEIAEGRLARHLTLVALDAESPGLDEPPLAGRAWLERLRGPETDATFLIRRLAALDLSLFVRDRVYDELGLMIRLAPGPDTPCRTTARQARAPLVVRARPLHRERPNLRGAAARPPRRIRDVGRREAMELIDLARSSMVTRSRDLDQFVGADPRDVRLIECEDGLAFACLGVVPERRLLVEAVYGFLILQNGVPIGYALTSALWKSSEIAFNVFESFRGGEAAYIYGWLMGTLQALFRTDTFTIFPYQLGHENEEGIESGAWWFYYKLGFRPRDRQMLALAHREVERMRRRRTYRSRPATLRKLARRNVFFEIGRRRDDVIGVFPLDRVGLAVTDYVVRRFGADRERAARICADEVAALLGAGNWRGFPASERLAWVRLSPLVRLLPGVGRWPAADRHALARLVRAKGGRRESDYVALLDGHARFRRALLAVARA